MHASTCSRHAQCARRNFNQLLHSSSQTGMWSHISLSHKALPLRGIFPLLSGGTALRRIHAGQDGGCPSGMDMPCPWEEVMTHPSCDVSYHLTVLPFVQIPLQLLQPCLQRCRLDLHGRRHTRERCCQCQWLPATHCVRGVHPSRPSANRGKVKLWVHARCNVHLMPSAAPLELTTGPSRRTRWGGGSK